MSLNMLPRSPQDDLPNVEPCDAVVFRQGSHRFAVRRTLSNCPNIILGDFCGWVRFTPKRPLRAQVRRVIVASSDFFRMHARTMALAARQSLRMDTAKMALTACQPLLVGGIRHIGVVRADPQMTESKISNASDDVDTNVIIADTRANVAGMTRHFGGKQRSSDRDLKGEAVRPMARNLDVAVPQWFLSSDPAGISLDDVRPERINGRLRLSSSLTQTRAMCSTLRRLFEECISAVETGMLNGHRSLLLRCHALDLSSTGARALLRLSLLYQANTGMANVG